MAVPKKKTPKSRRNKRRSHHALKRPNLTKCPRCKATILPHIVCPDCGFYKDRDILKIEKNKAKAAAKKKARKDRNK